MRLSYNNLSIEAYSSGTTRIADPKGELLKIQGLNFTTQYPGGLCSTAQFYVPRNIVDWWEANSAVRFTIRNDLTQVWEGYPANFQDSLEESAQGCLVRLNGFWGDRLMNWLVRKCWADDRITDDVWRYQSDVTVYTGTEKCWVDRQNRLRFTPKAEAWTSGQLAAVRRTMPTGETIKRITYDYQLAEGGQAWEISVWRSTDGSSWTQMTNASGETYATGTNTVVTTSATGAIDVTLATPSQYLELRYYARGNQTPSSDGTYFGEFSSLILYSETGSINMAEIAKDIVATVTDLNSNTDFIFSAGTPLSLVPYLADDFQSAADILADITGRGDGTYARWAAWLLPSEWRAYVPDGKPILTLQTYVSTSAYEYVIRLDEDNLVLPVEISEDRDSIRNWIAVVYNDLEGNRQWRSPADAATLKDDTSIAAYGRKSEVISLPDSSTSAIADAVGARYLASLKDPQYRLTSALTVSGHIRGTGGNKVPASEIRAGYRVKLEGYGPAGSLTFVITGTSYDHDTQTCAMTIGVPDAPLALRYIPPPAPEDHARRGPGDQVTPRSNPVNTGGARTRRPKNKRGPDWEKKHNQERKRRR